MTTKLRRTFVGSQPASTVVVDGDYALFEVRLPFDSHWRHLLLPVAFGWYCVRYYQRITTTDEDEPDNSDTPVIAKISWSPFPLAVQYKE
jgi:hypothetical protein